MDDNSNDLGFSYRQTGDGRLRVERHGRLVETLAGARVERFLARAQQLDHAGIQLALAKLTGNYRRGNERTTSRQRHPGSRGR